MAMAALPIAQKALDPETMERIIEASRSAGNMLAHNAGVTKDEGYEGAAALAGIGVALALRVRRWWRESPVAAWVRSPGFGPDWARWKLW